MAQRRVHYVLSSHWDREWYQTFQDYRYRLVALLDDVLDGLAQGTLGGPFQMDGQSLPIEDYLEVRPERKAFVQECVQQGKLLLGPWYVLPDESLVSGESMVRNLERGIRTAQSLGGEASRTAFVCDIFGHNSQLPQIMAGFGIHTGFIWRGTNMAEHRHVIWEGADGTELVCYRFGRIGYCSFALQVRKAGDASRRQTPEELEDALDAFIQEQQDAADAAPLLLFDGCDHQGWDKNMYQIIQDRIKNATAPLEYVHSSLDAFADELYAERSQITTRLKGELRAAAIYPGDQDNQWLIPGVLSSRVRIKQSNATCETLLCSWAEPLSVMTNAWLGSSYPKGYLDVAWGWLLKNHPHDSICGCSIDAVHRDMAFRFHQTKGIADRLAIEATKSIAANVQGEIAPDELRVCVFNPASSPHTGTTELALQIPCDWPCFNERFGFEEKPAFRIYDPEGIELPYQRLGQSMGTSHWRIHYDRTPESYKSNTVKVCLSLDIPAVGYTTLTVRAGKQGLPTRYPETPGLATAPNSMENEYLAVSVTANGSLTLRDKRTGQVYTGLLSYEDRADIGDGWYHGTPVNDQAFSSCASSASVALVQDGPMMAALRIRTRMHLPAAFCFDSMTRSDAEQVLVLDTMVTLRKGADHIEVQTRIRNNVLDHRLCVLFPSGAGAATTYEADAPFDVIRRPIALDPQRHTWRESQPETHPQKTWTAVCDDKRGLAIISKGLYEAAVRDLPDRPIALTLYRSTKRTVGTDGEPDGELNQQELMFNYWIVPIDQINRTKLCSYGQTLAGGLRTAQLQANDMPNGQPHHLLAATGSLFEASGTGVITSTRVHDDMIEIRLFNPCDTAEKETLCFDKQVVTDANVRLVDLEGHPVESSLIINENTISLTVRPHGIVTLSVPTEAS